MMEGSEIDKDVAILSFINKQHEIATKASLLKASEVFTRTYAPATAFRSHVTCRGSRSHVYPSHGGR